MISFEVRAGASQGTKIERSGDVVRIGSAADNDVILTGPTIEAHHARLHAASTGLILEDLGTAGGTARIRQGERTVTDVVRSLLLACFFMSAGHGALYVFYSVHLVEHGYSKTLVAWMWTLGVIAEIAVFMGMPQLLRAFSLRGILVFSFAAAILRFLLIGWAADSLALLLFAQVLHGATFGAYHAAAVVAVNEWFGTQHQARGQALYGSISFGAGGMMGGVLSGYTWDWIGSAWTYSLGAVFALIGLLVRIGGWREPSADERV